MLVILIVCYKVPLGRREIPGMSQVEKDNAGKKSHVVLCSGRECWGDILRKGKRSREQEHLRISRHIPGMKLGATEYHKGERSSQQGRIRADYCSFLCAIQKGKRQICPNKSREGVTCTYSGEENARVWLVDTVGNM